MWATLESSIDGTIAKLAETDDQTMSCITAQLIGPARRMDALLALFLLKGGSENVKKELKSFQGRLQQLGEDRNRVVHDPLIMGKKTGRVYKGLITAKGQLKFSLEEASLSGMRKTASDIKAMGDEFTALKAKIFSDLKPSAPK